MNKLIRVVILFVGVCCLEPTFAATSSELRELPAFVSSNHVLDVLIIARAKQIELGEFSPTAWIYQVCYRRDAIGDACPADKRTSSEYGGMRLQVNPGDHLKMRFINQLPPAPAEAKHLNDPMGAILINNPTNLHTHGLIVEPRQPSASNPSYGDYIYVLGYPNGKLTGMAVPGLDMTDQPIDYDIYIPLNHPSGSFWIHPHVHGLALNQMSYGLAGLLTVGSAGDYVTGPAEHEGRDLHPDITVRNMIFKDMQLLPDGTVQSQEDPSFCAADSDDESMRDGYCPGQAYLDDSGNLQSYIGGKWFSTINGQVHPTIHVGSEGEIWRITQASGSRSYHLQLQDSATGKPLAFQVLAVDGVTLDANSGGESLAKATGNKMNAVPCPAALRSSGKPVCTDTLYMMPAARVEIWIPATEGRRSSAELVSDSYDTGPAGDDWPELHLAHVEIASASGRMTALKMKTTPGRLMEKTGLLGSDVKIDAGAKTGEIALQDASAVAAKMPSMERKSLEEHVRALSAPEAIPSAACSALPKGHRRRIFFGLPLGNPDGFGVGYEEVDSRGKPVPGTFQELAQFDHSIINVCVPLERGNKTATENWELVNVSGEDHNFHIHQTKFQVLTSTDAAAPPSALMDNVPVPHGSDECDGSIDTWRSGACQVNPVVVRIPFSEVGDFVYHCHILEHEDGGMMAHIRVVPAS